MTTTSGMAWKIPGRAGDSPILGAGLYVDGDVGAAGSTGRGEANLYNLCSFLVVENMRRGMHPKDAGMDALKRMRANTVEKRLLNARGPAELPLNFYVLNAKGEYAGVSMYPSSYAVCTENGPQIVPSESLFPGPLKESESRISGRGYQGRVVVMRDPLALLAMNVLLAGVVLFSQGPARPRARDLGIEPGAFPPGPLNAITDVAGVRVGHATVIEGDDVRTGVTAILPHDGNLFQDKVAGAVFVGNAFGKLAGSTQVNELGTIETPIVLTNTLSVGTAVEAIVEHTLAQEGNAQVQSVNALVGETNDGGLNDIRGRHVTKAHVLAAIRGAAAGPVAEGAVGAGTGTRCFGWKGGIGTASRSLPPRYGGYRLGVLVQTNFGGILTMAGAPVGRELGRYAFSPPVAREAPPPDDGDGSCMIVVATDAPADARDLRRLAARALFGLARTGSWYSNGSGDFAIAFSTSPEMRTRFNESAPRARTVLPPDGLSPLFQAALEATEEAVYNSLLQATAMTGRGLTVDALPVDRVKAILQKHGIGVQK